MNLTKKFSWKTLAYLLALLFLIVSLAFGGYSMYEWLSGRSNFEPYYELSSIAVSLFLSVISYLLGKRASDNSIIEGVGRDVNSYLRNQNRSTMISRVNNFWIKGYLAESLDMLGQMDVSYQYYQATEQSNWITSKIHSRKASASVQSLLSAFNDYGRSLVIIGEPGSGKTIKLLQMTNAFIAEAKESRDFPIPVVLKLSTWAEKQSNLVDWIVEELNQKYQVPHQVGRGWIKQNELLLMLDGLDEVGEDNYHECVRAIKQFRQEYGLTGLVVTCRESAFLHVSKNLAFPLALLLMPLKKAQIRKYLRSNGLDDQTIGKLLSTQETSQLTTTPLNLSIIAKTVGDNPKLINELLLSANSISYLYENYVGTMLKHRSVTGIQSIYSSNQIRRFLSWLSKNLRKHSQTIFIIENIQPSWLDSKNFSTQIKYMFFSRMGGGILAGLAFSLLYLFYKLFSYSYIDPEPQFEILLFGVVFLILFGIFIGLTVGIFEALRLGGYNESKSDASKTRIAWYLSRRLPFSFILATVVACAFWALSQLWRDVVLLSTPNRVWISIIVGMLYSIVMVLGNYSENLENEIKTTSFFSWSWSKFSRSLFIYGVLPSGVFLLISIILLIMNDNKNIVLWNLTSSAEIDTLAGHYEPTRGFVFSDNGDRLLTLGENKSAILWDIDTGIKLGTIPLARDSDFDNGIAASPNLTYVLTQTTKNKEKWMWSYIEVQQSGFTTIWNIVDGRKVADLDRSLPFWAAQTEFSSDENLMLIHGIHGSFGLPTIVDLPSGTIIPTLVDLTGTRTVAALAKSGEFVVIGDDSGRVMILDARSGRKIREFSEQKGGEITDVSISSDSQVFIATSKNGSAKIWNFNSEKPIITVYPKNKAAIIEGTIFDQNTKCMIIDDTKMITIYNIPSGKLLAEVQGHTRWVNPYQFSTDEKILAVLSNLGNIDSNENSGYLVLWDLANEKRLAVIRGNFEHFKLSPNGKELIAVDTQSGAVELWDTTEGKLIRRLEDAGGNWRSIAFSPNGQLLATISKGAEQIYVWDSKTGVLLNTILKNQNNFSSIEFLPNKSTIISTSSFKDYRPLSFLFLSLGLIIALTIASERKKVVDEIGYAGRLLSKFQMMVSTFLIGSVFGTSASFVSWFIIKGDSTVLVLLSVFEAGFIFSSVLFSLSFGSFDIIKRSVLFRILTTQNNFPKDLTPLLDYVCDLLLLRKVGSGYIFIHPMIQDYFINMQIESEQN